MFLLNLMTVSLGTLLPVEFIYVSNTHLFSLYCFGVSEKVVCGFVQTMSSAGCGCICLCVRVSVYLYVYINQKHHIYLCVLGMCVCVCVWVWV